MAKGFKQPKVEIAPELQFISKESIEAAEQEEQGAAGQQGKYSFHYIPQHKEARSKRVQLVVQPSIYAKLKVRADAAGTSFNDYCHAIFEEITRED